MCIRDRPGTPTSSPSARSTPGGWPPCGPAVRSCLPVAGPRPPATGPVDAALRPEGKNGPLVRTVASHRAYYERWAKTWEFQALLKARVVAGDAAVGEAYRQALDPLVWSAAEREHFVEDA